MREDTINEALAPEETADKTPFLARAKAWLSTNWPTLAGVAVGTGLAAYLLAKREDEPREIEAGDEDSDD